MLKMEILAVQVIAVELEILVMLAREIQDPLILEVLEEMEKMEILDHSMIVVGQVLMEMPEALVIQVLLWVLLFLVGKVEMQEQETLELLETLVLVD